MTFMNFIDTIKKYKTVQNEMEVHNFLGSRGLTNLSFDFLEFFANSSEESLKVLFLLIELCQLLLNSTILIPVVIKVSFSKILKKSGTVLHVFFRVSLRQIF